MSVLSKRWVSLWKSLPFLHFSFDTLRDLLDIKEEEDEALWTFGSFIVHVISQRYPTANLVRSVTLLLIFFLFIGNSIHFSKKYLPFPALKSLDLTGIHALNLKKLVISELEERQLFLHRCKLEIHAPKLTTFEYFGQFRIVCSTERLTSLDDVCFDIVSNYFCHEINKEEFPYVMNTLKELDHVKSLTLSIQIIEVLSEFPELLDDYQLSFANLKHLKLNVPGYSLHNKELFQIDEHVLKYFLNSSTVFEICP
ncbi:hypothetical protein COLO4_32850 [Corchorus olitorius]|uniref:Uncharacterized protein n=1 Tax=Corchorus olitorius TaxID=93759 RepID=A0A1R3GXQ3_9ROSI|nr:hypothetical protein COLO4_32850 [Corchorus olitorius]